MAARPLLYFCAASAGAHDPMKAPRMLHPTLVDPSHCGGKDEEVEAQHSQNITNEHRHTKQHHRR